MRKLNLHELIMVILLACGGGLCWSYGGEGTASDAPISPCYLNIMNPLDVAFGEGIGADLVRIAREVGEAMPMLGSWVGCLAATHEDPVFPQDNLRDRP